MKLTPTHRRQRILETLRLAKKHGCYKLSVITDTMYIKGRCIHCGKSVVRQHAWFRRGCMCQRNLLSQDRLRAIKQTHRDFFADAKTRGIKIISWPGKFQATGKFKCVKCGHVWKANANNVKRGSGCPTCAVLRRSENAPLKRPEIRAKFERTMMRKYGVRHALQNRDLFDKAFSRGYRHYDYQLGNRKIRVQGYEPYALDWLITEAGISPKNIYAGRGSSVPTVKYKFRGKTHTYHPDIYLDNRNMLIEVKSWYTYKCSYELNRTKRRAAKRAGFRFMFLVMNRDGTRRDVSSKIEGRKQRIRRPSIEKDSRRRSASF